MYYAVKVSLALLLLPQREHSSALDDSAEAG
jgi:hypothetical protein